MVNRLLFILILAVGNEIFAQTTDCKVNMPSISGTYLGGCKKGLAHGKGVAQGIDRYEGDFIKGLPGGAGKYTWASGVYYEGKWKNGLREGEGKMVYPDSVVTGIWQKNEYMGIKQIPPYVIITSMSVARSSINRSAGKLDGVKIRIMQGGNDSFTVEDFSMVYDSGSEYRSGNYYGIENVIFPVTVKVKYRQWNQLMSAQFNVIFEFVINQPGSWDVVLTN
jgi:hypothetical protein